MLEHSPSSIIFSSENLPHTQGLLSSDVSTKSSPCETSPFIDSLPILGRLFSFLFPIRFTSGLVSFFSLAGRSVATESAWKDRATPTRSDFSSSSPLLSGGE